MLKNRLQDGSTVSAGRALATPLAFAVQVVLGALEEEHANLPITTSLDVQMRGEMVREIEPELEPLDRERFDLSHAGPWDSTATSL